MMDERGSYSAAQVLTFVPWGEEGGGPRSATKKKTRGGSKNEALGQRKRIGEGRRRKRRRQRKRGKKGGENRLDAMTLMVFWEEYASNYEKTKLNFTQEQF